MKTYLIYYPIFWLGYLWFRITNQTQWYPYLSFRRLFVLTKGRSNDELSRRLSKKHPPYPVSTAEGILGKLTTGDIDSIVQSIDKNGFHIFEEKLSADMIDTLMQFALKNEAELIPPGQNGEMKAVYNRKNLLSPRYQFPEKDLMQNPLIQRLSVDPTLFAVAQGYLRSRPIQDLTAMWWSTVFSRVASSEAAQLYHFDMDRIKFIKFFFYLTDVSTETGPHCYIRGSHKYLPGHLWKDGRILDKEIEQAYKKEDIIEIDGPKGSIIAVDTRGLHKGKALEKGERLILQFEFTNSLFGAPYQEINLKNKISPDDLSAFKANTYTFQRFKF